MLVFVFKPVEREEIAGFKFLFNSISIPLPQTEILLKAA